MNNIRSMKNKFLKFLSLTKVGTRKGRGAITNVPRQNKYECLLNLSWGCTIEKKHTQIPSIQLLNCEVRTSPEYVTCIIGSADPTRAEQSDVY